MDLLVKHIPGKLILADTLSRSHKPVKTEWMLYQGLFDMLCQIWDHPNTDLFATDIGFTSLRREGVGERFFIDLVGMDKRVCVTFLRTCQSGCPQDQDTLLAVHTDLLVDYPRDLPLEADLLYQPASRA